MSTNAPIRIPGDIKPSDGRFGSGPSRVPADAMNRLAATGTDLIGTSHRQAPVKQLVSTIRQGLATLYDLPDGYEVVLGLGGATAFWDAAAFGLIEQRSAHFVCGEFSSKFASVTDGAPFLASPVVHAAEPGSAPTPQPVDDVDAVAFIHNETSTGVTAPFSRVGSELTLVDGTSAAGAIPYDVTSVDAYYFSPQKALASEGGLWCAFLSSAAIARVETIAATDRWVPPFLSLPTAIANSRKDQTYNTPAIATLYLLAATIEHSLETGGLSAAAAISNASSSAIYEWADGHDLVTPFVTDPALRSSTVVTVDVDDAIDADDVCAVLRANGIVDINSYRKLGRNQLRIATFPATPTEDVEALLAVLDFVFEQIAD